jgi:hypothetical protein
MAPAARHVEGRGRLSCQSEKDAAMYFKIALDSLAGNA